MLNTFDSPFPGEMVAREWKFNSLSDINWLQRMMNINLVEQEEQMERVKPNEK
jgi:hypothetical protein